MQELGSKYVPRFQHLRAEQREKRFSKKHDLLANVDVVQKWHRRHVNDGETQTAQVDVCKGARFPVGVYLVVDHV